METQLYGARPARCDSTLDGDRHPILEQHADENSGEHRGERSLEYGLHGEQPTGSVAPGLSATYV